VRTCKVKPTAAIAPGIHPTHKAAKNGILHPNGKTEAANVAASNGYKTNEYDGETTSFSMNHEATEDSGNTTHIAGIKSTAYGVNMLIIIGAYRSVIFIHHISGRGAASNPRAGMN
jgi:hypothetical protein